MIGEITVANDVLKKTLEGMGDGLFCLQRECV